MDTRNRLSHADWEKILAEQIKSGQSAKRYCLERGIKPTSYYSATKRHRLSQAMTAADNLSARRATQVPAPKAGTTDSVPTHAAFVSVQIADKSGAVHRESAAIRVQLRGGHQLWVGAGFDAAHLGRLVAVLESAS
jgi:fructosamine-3-kinase